MSISDADQNAPSAEPGSLPSLPDELVVMPDLFVSFLAIEPQINLNYEKVKKESEDWFADDTAYKKLVRADFPYAAAIWAREAGHDEFRTICDYVNWAFDFDDMFDEGHLKGDTKQAAIQLENLMNVMKTNTPNPSAPAEDPLLEVFKTVWYRIAERSSEGTRKRFLQAVRDYTDGVTSQVKIVSTEEQQEEGRYLAIRRNSAGLGAIFALIEYFYALDLPDEIFQHASVQKMDRVARDVITIHNDALSFPKELADGVDQNLVAIFGRLGIPPQEAYDKLGCMLNDLYPQWYLAQAELPSWGEKIDRQVQKYIGAMQDAVRSNLYWSFRTVRYFGKQTDYVRQTRIISMPSEQLIKSGLTLPRTKASVFHSSDVGISNYNSSPLLTDASTISTGSSPQSDTVVVEEDKPTLDKDLKRVDVQSNDLELASETPTVLESY